RARYGYSLGILMLEARFPRIPGDLGNATTFPYPVLYHVVRGASPERVVLESDPTLLEPFVAGAQQLERGGVRAITTNCGFLALFQRELAASDLLAAHPDLGALVFECTNMAPYAHAVQAATGLPVFDIQTLIDHVYRALHRRPYLGEL